MSVQFSNDEFNKLKKLLSYYEWGMAILMTKLNILHDDLKNHQDNGAIDHIRGRVKDASSIALKLDKMGVEISAENAKKYLRDIAGIRIISPFAKDIYFLVESLHIMPEVKIVEEKDYIGNPKPSGYRSYHLITEVPVFHSGKTEDIPVEVQIRTEAMNFWATLEHRARYKYKGHMPKHLTDELIIIADKIAELDHRMFLIHDIISLINS